MSGKEQFELFKNELEELLKKHSAYLYAEDGYGAEILEISAHIIDVFDGIVQTEEDVENVWIN